LDGMRHRVSKGAPKTDGAATKRERRPQPARVADLERSRRVLSAGIPACGARSGLRPTTPLLGGEPSGRHPSVERRAPRPVSRSITCASVGAKVDVAPMPGIGVSRSR